MQGFLYFSILIYFNRLKFFRDHEKDPICFYYHTTVFH